MCMGLLPARMYLSAPHTCLVPREARKGLKVSLELELQMVVTILIWVLGSKSDP